ncbi:hypothetical protein FIE12Z_1353 [Fusarium flagelliforme]|uniref:Uncharacterized protein n=1 Tax=Fusarium flagelliforme TaxID=2675880 RepID=A0A395N2U3_9HYPO|nr:hypothetical protein FIE12Z_1353 [Fusarium flagelliforme]
MAEYESLHQLIVKNPWICRDPLSWTDKHLKLLNIQFQPIAPIAPYPSICRSYCDPSIAYGKQFVAGLTSEAKRAALVKLFRILGCGLVHPTEAMATFMFAGKEPSDNPGARIGGNAPVARLCRKRLRAATPAEWSKDPYIVGLILSLAQWSWRQERHPLLLLLPVRLIVTTDHDPKTVHVFKANVSIRLLECIYWPGLSLEGVTWPVIRHLQVASEPVCNFPDRLLFEVLGVRYF